MKNKPRWTTSQKRFGFFVAFILFGVMGFLAMCAIPAKAQSGYVPIDERYLAKYTMDHLRPTVADSMWNDPLTPHNWPSWGSSRRDIYRRHDGDLRPYLENMNAVAPGVDPVTYWARFDSLREVGTNLYVAHIEANCPGALSKIEQLQAIQLVWLTLELQAEDENCAYVFSFDQLGKVAHYTVTERSTGILIFTQ